MPNSQRIAATPEEIQELKDEFNDMRGDVKEIKDALLGSEFTQKKGLIFNMDELSKRVDALEKWKTKYINIMIGISVGAGFGLQELFKVLYAFITVKH